jgi:hypothetical protein
MGRPPSIIEDYREWQCRLERYQTHEVNLDVFCLQEGVSRSTFYRWKRRLDNGGFRFVSRVDELMRLNRCFRFDAGADGRRPQDRGVVRRTYQPAL